MYVNNVTPEVFEMTPVPTYSAAEVTLTYKEVHNILDALSYRNYYDDADLIREFRSIGDKIVDNQCDKFCEMGLFDTPIYNSQKINAIKNLRAVVPAASLKQAKQAIERRGNALGVWDV